MSEQHTIKPDFIEGDSPTLDVLKALSHFYGTPYRLAPTKDQLPPEIKRWAAKHAYGEGLQAVYDREMGEMWLITSELAGPHDAATAFLHEFVGHHGVGEVLKERRQEVMGDVYDSFADSPILESINEKYGLDLSKRTNQMAIAEELVSHMAQTGERASTFARASLALKEKVAQATGKRVHYTDADIRALCERARDSLSSLRPESGAEVSYLPTAKNQTIADILGRANSKEDVARFSRWIRDSGLDAKGLDADPNTLLDAYSYFLEAEYGIKTADDGTLSVAKINDEARRLVGDLPIAVTLPLNSAVNRARQGLDSGYISGARHGLRAEAGEPAKVRIDQVVEQADGSLQIANVTPNQLLNSATDGRFAALYVGVAGSLPPATESAFARAIDLEAHGSDAAHIKRETGWRRGLDQRWRFEINDRSIIPGCAYPREVERFIAKSRALTQKLAETGGDADLLASMKEWQEQSDLFQNAIANKNALGGYIYHRELFSLYPGIENMQVVELDLGTNRAHYAESEDTIYISPAMGRSLRLGGDGLEQALSDMVHEVQHAIQAREGWARGSNVELSSNVRFAENLLKTVKSSPDFKREYRIYCSRLDTAHSDYDAKRLSKVEFQETIAEIESDWASSRAGSAYNTCRDEIRQAERVEDRYMRSAGEIEARAAAFRRLFTDSQRAKIDDFASEQKYLANATFEFSSTIAAMYAGRNAEVASIGQLGDAIEREKAGQDPRTIFRETGWFRGYDDKWRFEISDHDATLDQSVIDLAGIPDSVPVSEVVLRHRDNAQYDVDFFNAATGEMATINQLPRRAIMEMLPPDVTEQLTGMATPAMPEGAMAQLAYHGSAHRADQLTTTQVGTGAGRSEMGWGLHLTSDQTVAEYYQASQAIGMLVLNERDQLVEPDDYLYNGESILKHLEQATELGRFHEAAVYEYLLLNKSPQQVRAHFNRAMCGSNDELYEFARSIDPASLKGVLDGITCDVVFDSGALYETDIPDPDRLLNASAPMEAQPEAVRRAAAQMQLSFSLDGLSGQEFYRRLADQLGGDRQASMHLLQFGVPGMAYPATETMAPEGTQNFVIWDDAVVTIDKINGEAVRRFDVGRQTVYHGTPHEFDAFSIQKIGSGEGFQSFGWGLYFATDKSVGKFYAQALGKRISAHNTLDGKRLSRKMVEKLADSDNPYEQRFFKSYHGMRAHGRADVRKHLLEVVEFEREQADNYASRAKAYRDNPPLQSTYNADELDERAAYHRDYADGLMALHDRLGHVPMQSAGRLIEASIPSDEQLLDYDAAMEDQPPEVLERLARGTVVLEVGMTNEFNDYMRKEFPAFAESEFTTLTPGQQRSFIDAYREDTGRGVIIPTEPLTGEAYYTALAMHLGSDENASRYLNSLGIHGLRYADGNSRGLEQGSVYNYVIWDDRVVSVEAVNGQRIEMERQVNVAEATRENDSLPLDHASRMARAQEQGFAVDDQLFLCEIGRAGDPTTYTYTDNIGYAQRGIDGLPRPVLAKRDQTAHLTPGGGPDVSFTHLASLVGRDKAREIFTDIPMVVLRTLSYQCVVASTPEATLDTLTDAQWDRLSVPYHKLFRSLVLRAALRSTGAMAVSGNVSAGLGDLALTPLVDDAVRCVHDAFDPDATSDLARLTSQAYSMQIVPVRPIDGNPKLVTVSAPDEKGEIHLQGEFTLRPGNEFRLGDILEHERLYEAYPHTENLPVVISPDDGSEGSAYYDPTEKAIHVQLGHSLDLRRALLHEVMHDIQIHEGFAVGGTPESAAKLQREDNFARWFRDSHVVDASGSPTTVYHRTNAAFDVFNMRGEGVAYFADDPRYFRFADKQPQQGAQTVPAYLKLLNPAQLSKQEIETLRNNPERVAELKAAGHDGAIYKNESGWGDDFNQFVAFYPHQIKSALGNTGHFDVTSANVMRKEARTPFYSALINTLMAEMGDGQIDAVAARQALSQWNEAGRVSSDELRWSGIEVYLDRAANIGTAVTRDELIRVVSESQVRLAEVVKTSRADELAAALVPSAFSQPKDGVSPHTLSDEIELHDLAVSPLETPQGDEGWAVVFQGETIAHGPALETVLNDAREIIAQWPERIGPEDVSDRVPLPNYRELVVIADVDEAPFNSLEHYEDNVLGLVALNDATDASGKKVLQIGALSSDWHTQLRENGARPSELPDAYFHLSSSGSVQAMALSEFGEYEPVRGADFDSLEQAQAAVERLNKRLRIDQPTWPAYSRSPEYLPTAAPHADGWMAVLVRRVIQRAIDEGYDRIDLPSTDTPLMSEAETRMATERLPKEINEYVAQFGTQVTEQGGRNGFDISSQMRESVRSNGQPMFRLDAEPLPRYVADIATRTGLKDRMISRAIDMLPARGSLDVQRDVLAKAPLIVMPLKPSERLSALRGRLETLRRYDDERAIPRGEIEPLGASLDPIDQRIMEELPLLANAAEYLDQIETLINADALEQYAYLWTPMDSWMSTQRPVTALSRADILARANTQGLLCTEVVLKHPPQLPTGTIELRGEVLSPEGDQTHVLRWSADNSDYAVYQLEAGFYCPATKESYQSLDAAAQDLASHLTERDTSRNGQDRRSLFISAERGPGQTAIDIEVNFSLEENPSGERQLVVQNVTNHAFHEQREQPASDWQQLLGRRLAALALEEGAESIAWSRGVTRDDITLTDVIIERGAIDKELGEPLYRIKEMALDGHQPVGVRKYTFAELLDRVHGDGVHELLKERFENFDRNYAVFKNGLVIVSGLETDDVGIEAAQDMFSRIGMPLRETEDGFAATITPEAQHALQPETLPTVPTIAPGGAAVTTLHAVLPKIVVNLPRKAPASEYAQRLETMQGKGHFRKRELVDSGVLDWLAAQPDATINREMLHSYLQAHQVRLREHVFVAQSDQWWATPDTPSATFTQSTLQGDGSTLHTAAATIDGRSIEVPVIELEGIYYLDGHDQLISTGSEQEVLQAAAKEAERQVMAEEVSMGDPRYSAYTTGGKSRNYGEIVVSVDAPELRFQSPHWPDIPNTLGHIRFHERTNAQGDRVLAIEELQMDWLQADRHDRLGEIDRMPFGGQAPLLMVKRAMDFAVRNGYDQIVWPNADDIKAMVPDKAHFALAFEPAGSDDGEALYRVKNQEGYDVAIAPLTASEILSKFSAPGLEAHVDALGSGGNNRSVFHGMITQKGTPVGVTTLYEQIIPAQVDRFISKYGLKVEQLAFDHAGGEDRKRSGFRINDALRREVLDTGLPMYSLAPTDIPDITPASERLPGLDPSTLDRKVVREALHYLHPEHGKERPQRLSPEASALVESIRADRRSFIEIERELTALCGGLQSDDPANNYRSLAGEAEARSVEARADLTVTERRDRMPMTERGVTDRKDAIVSFDGTSRMGCFIGPAAFTYDSERAEKATARLKELELTDAELDAWHDLGSIPVNQLSPAKRKLVDHLSERLDQHQNRYTTVWKETGVMLWLGDAVQELDTSGACVKATIDELRAKDYLELGANKVGTPSEIRAFTNSSSYIEAKKYPLTDVLDFPELYKAYPQLAFIMVADSDLMEKTKASFQLDQGVITYNRRLSAEQLRSSLLHEIQHVIAAIDDLTQGSSPERHQAPDPSHVQAFKVVNDAIKLLEKQAASGASFEEQKQAARSMATDQRVKTLLGASGLRRGDLYRERARLKPLASSVYAQYDEVPGEQLAREVQARAEMTPEGRASTPPSLVKLLDYNQVNESLDQRTAWPPRMMHRLDQFAQQCDREGVERVCTALNTARQRQEQRYTQSLGREAVALSR